MKKLSGELADHLISGTTTLCTCFRVTRKDGHVFGFTDHDNDLTWGGTIYEAASAFQASEMEEVLGLGVDNMDVASALNSDQLLLDELEAGLFDSAEVEIFLVNWQDTDQHQLLKSGRIGEMRYGEGYFTAEIRGLSHLLQQPKGRHFQYGCDAILGDAKCGVDITDTRYSVEAGLIEVTNTTAFEFQFFEDFEDGWFDYGQLLWLSGKNAGQSAQIRAGKKTSTGYRLDFWGPQPFPPEIGASARLSAGCNRHLSTCRDKFSNAVNFRGFPSMPGNDFLLKYPAL